MNPITYVLTKKINYGNYGNYYNINRNFNSITVILIN
ncbi:hypothetical protein IWX80_002059 [Flavobacterium sp. CAN_S2]